MNFRKIASAAAVAAALSAPTMFSTQAQAQLFAPTPVQVFIGPVFVGAAAISLVVNSIVTYQTECRELTSNEAITNVVLPGVGMVYNVATSKTNKCGKAVRTKG